MKTILISILLLVACSAPVASNDDASTPDTRVQCEAIAASACAHCCEVQPYVAETKDGTMFTRPIEACSSTPLPATWSVDWCMTDCEAAAVEVCQ